MGASDDAPPPAEVVARNPKAEVDEVLDFYKYALRKDAKYKGTVVFDVKKSDVNPSFLVSVRVDPVYHTVETWDGLPPDGQYDCYTEVSRDDFFLVYSGKASIPQVGAMCLTGRIKVRWFRYQQLQQFASSFCYDTPLWIAFYRGRGDAEKAAGLMAQQWRAARKAGAGSKVVLDSGVLVDASTVPPDVRQQLEDDGRRYLGEPAPPPAEAAATAAEEAPVAAALVEPARVEAEAAAAGVVPTEAAAGQEVSAAAEAGAPAAVVADAATAPVDAGDDGAAAGAAAAAPVAVGGSQDDEHDAAAASSASEEAASPSVAEAASTEAAALQEVPDTTATTAVEPAAPAPVTGPVLIAEVVVPIAAAAGQEVTATAEPPSLLPSLAANASASGAAPSDATAAPALPQSALELPVVAASVEGAAPPTDAASPAAAASFAVAVGPPPSPAGVATNATGSSDASEFDLGELLPRLLRAEAEEDEQQPGTVTASSGGGGLEADGAASRFGARDRYRLQALGVCRVGPAQLTLADLLAAPTTTADATSPSLPRFVPLAQHLRATLQAQTAAARGELIRQHQAAAAAAVAAAQASAADGWLDSVSSWVGSLFPSGSGAADAAPPSAAAAGAASVAAVPTASAPDAASAANAVRDAAWATIRATEAAAAAGSVIALLLRAQTAVRPVGHASVPAPFPRGPPLRDVRALLQLLPAADAAHAHHHTAVAAPAAAVAQAPHAAFAALLVSVPGVAPFWRRWLASTTCGLHVPGHGAAEPGEAVQQHASSPSPAYLLSRSLASVPGVAHFFSSDSIVEISRMSGGSGPGDGDGRIVTDDGGARTVLDFAAALRVPTARAGAAAVRRGSAGGPALLPPSPPRFLDFVFDRRLKPAAQPLMSPADTRELHGRLAGVEAALASAASTAAVGGGQLPHDDLLGADTLPGSIGGGASLRDAFDAALASGPGGLLRSAEAEGFDWGGGGRSGTPLRRPPAAPQQLLRQPEAADARRATNPTTAPAASAVDDDPAATADLRDYLRRLRLRLGNEEARYREEERRQRDADEAAAAAAARPASGGRGAGGSGYVSWGPRHPLLVPPAAVPTASSMPAAASAAPFDDYTAAQPFGLALWQGFAALPVFAPTSLLPPQDAQAASVRAGSSSSSSSSTVPVTPLAAGVLAHWARAAPAAPVSDAHHAESAAYCLGFPLHWVGRRVVTLGAMVLPQQQAQAAAGQAGEGSADAAAAAADTGSPPPPSSAFFLPVWHPKALHAGGGGGGDGTGRLKRAGGSGGDGAHVARCAYDGLGSGVFHDNAVARVRLRYQQLLDASAGGGSGGGTAQPADASAAGVGGGDDEPPRERLPYAGRAVQQLLAAATPAGVRELARRLRAERRLKVYVPPTPPPLAAAGGDGAAAAPAAPPASADGASGS